MERESTQCAGRDAGAAELEDGSAVDAIAASIRRGGGKSSASIDDLLTASIRGLVDMQREVGDQAAEWAERQGPRTGDQTARLAVESVRSLLLLKIAQLAQREEPPSPDEIARLALALHRIEAVDKHRLAREQQAAAETAAPPAPREPPTTEEMRALLGPAIRKAFHPERLGSKPWEPWPDAPSPAEPVAGQPEPPWDPSAGHSAWDEPVAQGEEEAREARDGSDPEGQREAEDSDRAPERHDMGHVRGARDDVHAPKAHDDVHARKARDADDVPHIARPNRWSWNGELWPPEIPLDPSRW